MKVITTNKKAFHDYAFDKEMSAGIVLQGHEVKSIKASQVNIKDAIVRIDGREAWIHGMDVPLYTKTSFVLAPHYQAKGKRKLLLNAKELAKLSAFLDVGGNVILPLKLFVTDNGRIKLTLGMGKRMRKVEKKQILKEKDIGRQMARDAKEYR